MKHSFLRINTLSAVLLAMTAQVMAQEPTPPYLDDNQPIEVRVEDALSRMTLKEKIAIIHAQSKTSANYWTHQWRNKHRANDNGCRIYI